MTSLHKLILPPIVADLKDANSGSDERLQGIQNITTISEELSGRLQVLSDSSDYCTGMQIITVQPTLT